MRRETFYLDRNSSWLGDRVQHITGKLGRVTEVRPGNANIGFGELAIKWDDGALSSQYSFANEFSLISRAPGKLSRIPRAMLAEMLRRRSLAQ